MEHQRADHREGEVRWSDVVLNDGVAVFGVAIVVGRLVPVLGQLLWAGGIGGQILPSVHLYRTVNLPC